MYLLNDNHCGTDESTPVAAAGIRRSRLDCGRRGCIDHTGGKHHEIDQRGLDGRTADSGEIYVRRRRCFAAFDLERCAAGTRSFALICDDPDAPAGTWVHWVIYGLPATATALAEELPPRDAAGWREAGVNDFRRIGYGGPCPRRVRPPLLFQTLRPRRTPALKSRATKVELLRAMAGHILAEARLMGTYQRAR